MFEFAGNEFDNVERFRVERMARIASDKEAFPLNAKGEGYCVLHIMPFGFRQRIGSVDFFQLKGDNFRQLGIPMGFTTRYGVDGFIVYRGGTGECHGCTASHARWRS